MTFLITFIVLYAIATGIAAYKLTDGFKIDFSGTALALIAIMWPLFLYLIAVSYYEEWCLKRRKERS